MVANSVRSKSDRPLPRLLSNTFNRYNMSQNIGHLLLLLCLKHDAYFHLAQ